MKDGSMKRATWLPLFLIIGALTWSQTPPQKTQTPALGGGPNETIQLSSQTPTKTATPPAASPASAQPTISSVLDRSLSNLERQLVGVAEAMPEDKYSFAPTAGNFKGVRTFAEQVKHVAAANNLIFSAILGEAPPTGDNENGPPLKTKAEIVKYLQDSFARGHRAVATVNEQNLVTPIKSPFGSGMTTRLGLATSVGGHCSNHYGQMVEYLRMNGIVPLASR